MPAALIPVLLEILNVVSQAIAKKPWECLLITVLCFAVAAIANPEGFANWALCAVVDALAFGLPQTPPEWQLATALTAFAAQNQAIGWGVIWEVIQVPIGLLGFLLTFKMVKLVRG